jgi:hypothetical protein
MVNRQERRALELDGCHGQAVLRLPVHGLITDKLRLPMAPWFLLLTLICGSAACGGLLCACHRDDPQKSPATSQPHQNSDRVEPPAVRPEYSFAERLRDEYPEVVAFVQQFMETCLAGDYAAYRKLVSRRADPENRDRFQAVFNAISRLHVESIRVLNLPQVSEEVYLVVSKAEFHPETKARLRRKHDQIAILVLKEEGQWRMMPAPPQLQPTTTSAPSTDDPDAASAPTTTSAPSYPWDQDGDF